LSTSAREFTDQIAGSLAFIVLKKVNTRIAKRRYFFIYLKRKFNAFYLQQKYTKTGQKETCSV